MAAFMIFFLICIFFIAFLIILLLHFVIFFLIYEYIYYNKSIRFRELKKSISEYVNECNELNEYIEFLKRTPVGFDYTQNGLSTYSDNSKYNYKRPMLNKIFNKPNVYNCSLSVCDNARKNPLKYICKYFNMKESEETLSMWEDILNKYISVEEGKIALKNKHYAIVKSTKSKVPFLIRMFSKKLPNKIGIKEIDFNTLYFPKYVFNYVSSGGNASTMCEIVMDIENITKMIGYINQVLEYKRSTKFQRTLMTPKLRLYILQRDDYKCNYCGASLRNEPNLLLEIDHIIPISKGGKTECSNLQTLCWRCNRSKGNKITEPTTEKLIK